MKIFLKNKYFYTLTTILFISSIISAQANPQVYINEVLSSNLTTNPDMVDFGDFSDWIELYNNENVDVDLSGFYLSDDFNVPMKWLIPNNTIIPAKGYFLIWADGFNDVPGKNYVRDWWPDNIQFTTKWCHTNFKLNKDSDKVGLFSTDGSIVDTVSFDSQTTDVSFGRQPDGTNNWFYFGEATPLKSNGILGINSTIQSGLVLFSVDGGFYDNPITLVLNSETGAGIIRYTTDGSKPTSSSNVYLTPITISENKIIRARLFENSKIPGKIITNTYFISETQSLPVVSMVTDPKFLWDKEIGIYINTYKEREIPISLEYFPLNSDRAFSMDAGTRIGGENIFRFAQKPLNIYARSNYGYSNIDYKVFDTQPYQEYKRLYLRNSGDDWPNTMFRDGLLVNILKGKISNSTQAFKPSVLYLNSSYWGIYNLREKIDEQYFFLHYNTDPLNLDHLESNSRIISGDSTDFVNLLSFAASKDLTETSNYSYIQKNVDLSNLMDFVIVQDYFANSSWGHNREVWRDNNNDNLWRWILVDMDRGFNSSRISTNQLSDIYNNFDLFRSLTNNTNFKNEFIQRYAHHLNHTFGNDRIQNIIDSLKLLIEPEMPRHIQKWGEYIDSLTIDIWGQTSGVSSLTKWNSEIQKLKNFSSQREVYAVQYLNDRFNLSGRSNLTVTTNAENKGKVYINDYLQNYDENNLFFNNVPLSIKAYPPPGYAFKHWKELLISNKLNVITKGSLWKYWDENLAPDITWVNTDYNDDLWKSGNAQFGYGDGDENTILEYGTDSQNKYITSYYRKEFQITDPTEISGLTINLLRDDGAVIYLNGVEILRSNMPDGIIQNSTQALSAVSDIEESAYFEFNLDYSNLVTGTNVISAEVHQISGTSSDVSFDLSLEVTLLQQTNVENIISTDEAIVYNLNGNTELHAEFAETSINYIPDVISGSILLTKANSPYYVINDITVQETGVLNIEAGTTIYFAPNSGIIANGQLLMMGTSNEPITLTSYYSSDQWGAVCFENSNLDSKLNHVNIVNATNGNNNENFFASLSSLYSTLELNNVHFKNVTLPISSQWSNIVIDSCTFEDVTLVGDYVNCNGGNLTISNSVFNGNNIADMDAIDIGLMTETTNIHDNTIINFIGSNSDGIDIGDASSNVSIKNNLIMNCGDKGISIGQGSNAVLLGNSIALCNLGVGIKDSSSYAEIINSTFYSNIVGVACFVKHVNGGGGSANIKNSIFANSKESSVTTDNLSSVVISYSISNTDILPGIENIFGNPLLINPDDANFYIQVSSPCRNNGDPQSTPNKNGSRSDIGAHEFVGTYQGELIVNEINYNSSPNFNTDDWVELYNNSKKALDVSGWVFISEDLSPSIVFNSGTILQSDSYIVICKDLTLFKASYPDVTNSVGNLISGLSGRGEPIFIYDNNGRLIDSLTYDDSLPWPLAADGLGSSLELLNPSFDNGRAQNWSASQNNGTPGQINSTIVSVNDDQNQDEIVPKEFALFQNYPNPFNPSTSINFEIPVPSRVNLEVYDALGQKIEELKNGELMAGKHHVDWNAISYTSGIYFIRMSAESNSGNNKFSSVIKAVIIK